MALVSPVTVADTENQEKCFFITVFRESLGILSSRVLRRVITNKSIMVVLP